MILRTMSVSLYHFVHMHFPTQLEHFSHTHTHTHTHTHIHTHTHTHTLSLSLSSPSLCPSLPSFLYSLHTDTRKIVNFLPLLCIEYLINCYNAQRESTCLTACLTECVCVCLSLSQVLHLWVASQTLSVSVCSVSASN